MASPKKYRAKLARTHVRILWLNVQKTKSQNRTQEDWLSAANRELEAEAMVKVGIGTVITMLPMEKPRETVDLTLSFEALCGIKLALVEAMAQAAFRERLDLLEAASGFGAEFEKMVRKSAKLPEADPGAEDELKGIPSIDETEEPRMKLLEKEESRG